jgi:hypothetical protein
MLTAARDRVALMTATTAAATAPTNAIAAAVTAVIVAASHIKCPLFTETPYP